MYSYEIILLCSCVYIAILCTYSQVILLILSVCSDAGASC